MELPVPDPNSTESRKVNNHHPEAYDHAAWKLWYKEPTIGVKPGTLLWRHPSIPRSLILKGVRGDAQRRVPVFDAILERLERITAPTECLPLPVNLPVGCEPGDYRQTNIAWPNEEEILLVSSVKLPPLLPELYAVKISAGGVGILCQL